MLLLLTGLVGVVPLAGREPNGWHDLIAPVSGCDGLCWQGIRANETGYEEAIALLQNNPGVVQLDTRQTLYAGNRQYIWYIYWTWQAHTGETVSGSLAVQAGVVRLIRIYKQIPFGLLWLLLGEPQAGSFVGTLIYHDQQPMTLPLYHTATYPGSGITIQTDADCGRFWWQPSMLTIRAPGAVAEAYDLSAYRRYACTGSMR